MRNYKGNAHERLCNLAASILEGRHYNVEYEKVIQIPEGGPQKRYVIDVYGQKDENVILVECGDCNDIKLKWLRENIGQVIHLPYLDKWFFRDGRTWRLSEREKEIVTERLSKRKW